MSAVKIVVEHDGVDYPAEVMTIKSTSLGLQHHGIWDLNLHCEGDGTGISVGGYCLDNIPAADPFGEDERRGTAFGMDQIMEIVKTVGVERWEQLPGKRIYVLFDPSRSGGWGGMSIGLANVDTGRALILKEHAARWMALKEIDA